MRCGRKPIRPLVTMPMPVGAHARQAERVVAQVVPGDEPDLVAAPVLVDVVDEGPREVRRPWLGHATLARRDRLERVHDVRDVDLLRAADRAEVAGHAHPGRVAVQDLVPHPGPDHREQIWRGVWSMSPPDGQEPPHVPHWMHVSSRESAGMAARTSSWKVGARVPPTGAGGGGTCAFGIVVRLTCSNARGPSGTVTAGGETDGCVPGTAHDSSRRDARGECLRWLDLFACPASLCAASDP